MSSVKKQYPTPLQKQLLIQLVEADPQLRSGKFSSTFTKKESEVRWRKIAEELNSLNGANKSWENWRKTWQDRKSHTKKKFANARRHSNMTGGGPPPNPPTDEDMIVLSTIPVTSLIGHTDCQESAVEKIGAQKDADTIGSLPTYILECEVTEPAEPIETMATTAQPMQSTRQRTTTHHQTMKRSLEAAENLNKALVEKNNYKKAFYEQFIEVMRQQTAALTRIANYCSARNSPYI